MDKIPEWAIGCLGGMVMLRRELQAGGNIYPVGYPARLVSLQSGWPDSDTPYATIALDPHDVWEENVSFEGIEPQRH